MTLVVPPPGESAFQNSNISNIKQKCVYFSGGRWWCSTPATGRRTPPTPSRLSPPLQQTSSEKKISFQFLFFPKCVSARQVVASMVVPPMGSPPTMHGPGDW